MSSKLLHSPLQNGILTPPPSQRRKGGPVIVDISLNEAGQQVFEVHGVGRTVRKRHVEDMAGELEGDSEDQASHKRQTPVRAVLGPVSPSSLNQDKITSTEGNQVEDSPTSKKTSSEMNIWCEEVESAFEEALHMIPKNGLTKIKIGGKSCGRNELISDYILQKTGKARTRKQVSSHIQVIKNLKKNNVLIELINNGPTDPSALMKFDDVFKEIFFQKSLGSTDCSATRLIESKKSSPKSKSPSSPRRAHKPQHLQQQEQQKKPTPPPHQPRQEQQSQRKSRTNRTRTKVYSAVDCRLRSFEMNNSENFFYTILNPNMEEPLRLKKNATVQNRFPNLHQYYKHKGEQISIVHNLVKLDLLDVAHTPRTKLHVELNGVDSSEDAFACKTVIYCFGNEVLNTNDDLKIVSQKDEEITLALPFASEFWIAFFGSIESNAHRGGTQKSMGVKGLTIKQVIYHKNTPLGYEKEDVRALILWEFTPATKRSTNLTTSRRLYLPNGGVLAPEPTFLSKLSEPVKTASPTTSVQNTMVPTPIAQDEPQLQLSHDQICYSIDTATYELGDDLNVPTSATTSTISDDVIVAVAQQRGQSNEGQIYHHHQQPPLLEPQYPVRPMTSDPWPQTQPLNHLGPHPHPPQASHPLQLHYHHQPQIQPQLTMESTELQDGGYSADDFQGFNNYGSDHVMNPGYMILDQQKMIQPEVLMPW